MARTGTTRTRRLVLAVGAAAMLVALPAALPGVSGSGRWGAGSGRWGAPEAVADPSIIVTHDIAYGDAPANRVDVYRPANPAAPGAKAPPGGTATPAGRPAVVVVHGGAWVGGDKSGEGLVAAALVKGGMVAFAINYQLATPTQPSWPQAFDDVQAAVRWVRSTAASWGVDPARIGALGDSAGGQLTALLAVAASGPVDTGSGVQAAVSWSGPMDLAALDQIEATVPCPRQAACLPQSLRQTMYEFLGCAPSACPDVYTAASPVHHVRGGDPPVMLFNSTHELMPETQASTMAVALQSAGIPHRVVILDGSQHGTDYAPKATGPSVAFLHTALLGLPLTAPRHGPPWWWWLVAAAVIGVGAVLVAVYRRRRYTWI